MALMVDATGSDEVKNKADADAATAADAADAARKDMKKEEEPLPDYDAVVAPADVEGLWLVNPLMPLINHHLNRNHIVT